MCVCVLFEMIKDMGKLNLSSKQDILDFLVKHNLFVLAEKIWSGIAIFLGIVLIVLLVKKLYFKSLFWGAGVLLSLFFRNHLISVQNRLGLKKYGKKYNL